MKLRSILLFSIFIFSTLPVLNVSANSDASQPVAHAEVEMRSEYENKIEDRDLKQVSGIDRHLQSIHLGDTG